VKRALAVLLAAASVAAPAAAAYPTHVPVSLTNIPGNTCCPKTTRASVSAAGVLRQYTMERSGPWKRVATRRLRPRELRRLHAELRRFNPASLRPGNSAACNDLPIGDVGGYDLKVGRHESNCPPPGASRLIRLLSGWLPSS
jgi:hypothetical protein